MTRLAASAAALCLYCLIGCGSRTLDLDHAAPAAAAPMGAEDPIVSGVSLTGVWLDEPRVYWNTIGNLDGNIYEQLYSCRTADCENTKVSYPKGEIMGAVAVAEGRVYWTSGSSLFSCVEGAEAKPTRVTADPALGARPIFAYRDYVYWFSDFDLYRCHAQGCAEPPELVAPNAHSEYLAFDHDRVYWSNPHRIMSAPSDGSELPKLVTEVPWATSLAISDGYLYWANTSQVFRCPIANCASETTLFVTAGNQVDDLKVDGSALYWLEYAGIYSCPLTGCEQSSLRAQHVATLRLPNESAHFAIDASYLYWLEADNLKQPNGNSLRMTAK